MPVTYDAAVGYDSIQLYSDVALDGTVLALQTLPALDAVGVPTGLVLTENAPDMSLGNKSNLNNGDFLIVHNTDSVARVVTVTATPDNLGRLRDLVTQVPAGKIAFLGPFKLIGWEKTDGALHYYADSSLVKLTPIRMR